MRRISLAIAKLPIRCFGGVGDVDDVDGVDDVDIEEDGEGEVEEDVDGDTDVDAAESMIRVLTTSTGVVITAAMAPAVPALTAVMRLLSRTGEGEGVAVLPLFA